jgi:hypothetical protein
MKLQITPGAEVRKTGVENQSSQPENADGIIGIFV